MTDERPSDIIPRRDLWMPAQISELERLWKDGVPTAEIGRRLGFTKNAVVGKAHRLCLPSRPNPVRREPSPAGTTHKPIKPKPKALSVSRSNCCWPIGHPGDKGFRFCAEASQPGSPYCAEHHKLAHIKSPKLAV